jgi:CHAT domain-containing protein
MRFRDPAGTIALTLPSGWALDLVRSSVTSLIFGTLSGPLDRHLVVQATPTRTGVHDDADWIEATRDHFVGELDATRADSFRPTGGTTGHTSPAVWAVIQGESGASDQRVLVVRGHAVDVTLAVVGASRGGRVRTPLLEAVGGSLFVPANAPIVMREREPWELLMGQARQAIASDHLRRGADLFWRAYRGAASEWQLGLRFRQFERDQLVRSAEALLEYAAVTGAPRALDDVTVLLIRAGYQWPQERARLEVLMDRAWGLHAGREQSARYEPLYAAGLRAEMATRLRSTSEDAEFMLEATARCLVMIRTMQLAGTAESRLSTPRRTSLVLVAAAAEAAMPLQERSGMRPYRDVTEAFRYAAQELHQLDPNTETRQLFVESLQRSARQLVEVGDLDSLAAAEALMVEAAGLLDGMPVSVVNEVWLASAIIQQALRQPAAVLHFAGRLSGNDPVITVYRAALICDALLLSGKPAPALEWARRAHGQVSTFHHGMAKALLANRRTSEALDHIRLGLLDQLKADPFGARTELLLNILGHAGTSEPALERAALALAVDLSDYHTHENVAPDLVVSYDDSVDRRHSVGALIWKLHEASDDLEALAVADHSRARTLAPPLTPPQRDQTLVDASDISQASMTLVDVLKRIAALFSAELTARGISHASGQELCALVSRSGRTTLVLHPTSAGLVRMLIRPGAQPLVDRRPSALVNEFARQTTIAVAQRGTFPDSSEAQIAAALDAWGRQPEQPYPASEVHRQMYDQVFGGLDLADGESVAVVPFRELALLPLSILTDQDEWPVIARHSVSTMPSIVSTLGGTALRRPASSAPRAVVIGDPQIDPASNLPQLPGARAEAVRVAALLGGHVAVTPLIGHEATEAAVRENSVGARILHLACHASVAADSDRSALYLTPAGADDGRLEVKDAEDLMLDEALVVLAACETGLGRPTSDGVNGLGRAFARAGARCVLLSLWRVGDTSTSILMPKLYEGILGLNSPRLDVADALASAQLATRSEHPDPSEWGPWLLVGDGGWRLD